MNRLFILATLVVAACFAMTFSRSCADPTGQRCAQGRPKNPFEAYCNVTCSALVYNGEQFVCPTADWRTTIPKYCPRPVYSEEAAVQAALTEAELIAQLVRDVKQACKTAGCIVRKIKDVRPVAPNRPLVTPKKQPI